MNETTSDNPLEDEGLVSFLQAYSSSPPVENKPCEELIMRTISQEKEQKKATTKTSFGRLFLLLPISFLSAFLMLSSHLFKQKLLPKIASGYEDVETFMVNSWQGSIATEQGNEEFTYTVITSEQ